MDTDDSASADNKELLLGNLGQEIKSLWYDLLSKSHLEEYLRDDYSPTKWADAMKRFETWADDRELYSSGVRSLDWRARKDPAYTEFVSLYLDDIKTSMEILRQLAVEYGCLSLKIENPSLEDQQKFPPDQPVSSRADVGKLFGMLDYSIDHLWLDRVHVRAHNRDVDEATGIPLLQFAKIEDVPPENGNFQVGSTWSRIAGTKCVYSN